MSKKKEIIHFQTDSSISNKELIEKMLDGEAELEWYNIQKEAWETFTFPAKLRIKKPLIEIPDEIYVNIYSNGMLFAHPSLKDAINSIDDNWDKSEFVTVVFRKEYVP